MNLIDWRPMTVASFLHPLNAVHQVFICQGEYVSPALHLKLLRAARTHGYQLLLIGQQHPDTHQAYPATAAFTPDALRADVISAPGIPHALAHVRAVNRSVFVFHPRGLVISEYERHLRRPARPKAAARAVITARGA